MRWIGYVATILWWSGIARSLSSLNRGYKISPKPCRVPHLAGVEGTCMFVWECINSEGTHAGVCVDTFMFGSCCVHNATSNSISSHNPSTSSNTLRPTLAEALSSESTRLTLTSLSSLSHPSSSTTRPSSQPPVSQKQDVSSTSQLPGSEDQVGSFTSHHTLGTPSPSLHSTRPLKPLPINSGRPLQKRPHAKPTSDQEDRLQTSKVPGHDSGFWEKNSQDSMKPQGGHQEAHGNQQMMKTKPEFSEKRPSVGLGSNSGSGDLQGFKDKMDNKHSTMLIRLPNKNQGSIKGQELRPHRPDYSQRPSESRPDDSKTEETDLAVQETMHRPSINSVDDKDTVNSSHLSLNFIHTEPPQWATKPETSSKPSIEYPKPYFSMKTSTNRPISINGEMDERPHFVSKPDSQNKPTKSPTTPRPTYYSSQSTSAAGSVPQTAHWQVTTEPAFVTKQKPSSIKPITIFETTRPGGSSSYYWSDNSWTPPKPSIKPHWTDHPNLMQNGPENFPQKPSYKPTETQDNEYHKPFGSAHFITTSYNETPTKSRPTKKTTPTTTTTTTTSTTTTTTTTTTQRPSTTTSVSTTNPKPHSESPSRTGSVLTIPAASENRDMQCGIPPLFPRPETRIVGGKDSSFGRWPWQVSVRRTSFFGFSSTHRCGGAVLNENWIATAGHCVDDLLISQIRIRVGEYDFSSVQERLPYVERSISKKVVHPKYNFFTFEYDLALVRLESPLTFAAHISPICLPAADELLIGQNATVTGWGRLSEGGTLPSVLQEVSVPIVSNDRCKAMFLKAGRHEFIPEIFLCAGYESGGQDSCQGDSGGPLQVRGKDGRYFLAGIISWGIGCAEANLPGVCTRISKFVPWILTNVA